MREHLKFHNVCNRNWGAREINFIVFGSSIRVEEMDTIEFNSIIGVERTSSLTLHLNNLANSSTHISSVIVIKCAIFDNLLHTTRIVFFSTTNSNFIIKSTIRYIHGFSNILFAISFPARAFILEQLSKSP